MQQPDQSTVVSVLMTCYNQEKYIGKAISSIQASTYQQWELIIVDDCSIDKSMSIARGYQLQDKRIKVYENDTNLGDYPNRNRAASYAAGKYLKYIDADDYIYPWGLKLMVDSMERYPDAGWGVCSVKPDTEQPFPFRLNVEEIFTYQNFRNSLFHNPPLSVIIKRAVFNEAGGFSGKRQMSDTEMWHLLALQYPVVLLPHGLVWYRVHDEQESVQIRTDISVRVRYLVAKYHFYKSGNAIHLPADKQALVVNKLKKAWKKSIMVHLARGKWKSAYIIYKAIDDNRYDFTGPVKNTGL